MDLGDLFVRTILYRFLLRYLLLYFELPIYPIRGDPYVVHLDDRTHDNISIPTGIYSILYVLLAEGQNVCLLVWHIQCLRMLYGWHHDHCILL